MEDLLRLKWLTGWLNGMKGQRIKVAAQGSFQHFGSLTLVQRFSSNKLLSYERIKNATYFYHIVLNENTM